MTMRVMGPGSVSGRNYFNDDKRSRSRRDDREDTPLTTVLLYTEPSDVSACAGRDDEEVRKKFNFPAPPSQ